MATTASKMTRSVHQPLPLPAFVRKGPAENEEAMEDSPAVPPLTAAERNAQACNAFIGKAHMDRLHERVQFALSRIMVTQIRRIRFDGEKTGLLELQRNKPFWWFAGRSYSAHRNIPPPLGARRWVYVGTAKPASECVRIQWDVSHEELVHVFHYWDNRSILTHSGAAACVEECRPSGRRCDPAIAAASPLRPFVWDLEEFARNHTKQYKYEAYKLSYDNDGVAILPPLTLCPEDIVPLTEHELHVLHRRPHLMRVLRKAVKEKIDDFSDTVDRVWRAERYDAERKARERAFEERYDRHAQDIYSEDEHDDRNDVSIIAEEPVLNRRPLTTPSARRLDESWVTEASSGSMNE